MLRSVPFQIGTREDAESKEFHPFYDLAPVCQSNCLSLFIKMDHTGCYRATATYQGIPLRNGEFNILVLSGKLLFPHFVF